jgi:hypothetical protein
MNTKIIDLLLYLFFGTAAVIGVFKFVKAKGWQSLAPKQILLGWKPFVYSVVPVTALLYGGQLGGLATPAAAPYFVGASLTTFIVTQIGLNPELRSLILMMLTVGMTLVLPTDFAQPILGVAAGLLIGKVVETLLHKPDSRLDDIAAPIIWLSAFYWSNAGLTGDSTVLCQEVVLATLLIAIFIRGIQPMLLANDRFFLKRVGLSITGGLAMLLLVTRVFMNEDLETTAILAGAGFFCTYLLQSLDRGGEDGPKLATALRNIFVVGIMTLAATRLFGLQGLLVLAAATTIAPQPGAALIAGLFFASRVLLQVYVVQYNTNVTGINLMHNYSNAALYAGFLLAAVAGLLIKDLADRRLLVMIYLATMFIGPASATYFVHAEPTGGLLISAAVAAVLISFLAPATYPTRSADQESLILMPVLATVVALLTPGLLELGDNASTNERVVALGVIAGIILCLALINHLMVTLDKRRVSAATAEAGVS